MRIGQGHDLHKLQPTPQGGIYLAGVLIPCEYECIAHSDGDVLLHACTDALLGAVAAGDIGRLFPDTDAANRDRQSSDFLLEALRLAFEKGFAPVNIDATIHLQKPKLAPIMDDIRCSLATLLSLPDDCVSVKAKTGEDLGSVGQSLAIAADAIVLMQRTTSDNNEKPDLIA